MSDSALRAGLIRLAHNYPEFRQDLLPLVTACGAPEAPMQGKFEEGKPADPTENMSEEDKKKWWSEHEKNKDQLKSAAVKLHRMMTNVRVMTRPAQRSSLDHNFLDIVGIMTIEIQQSGLDGMAFRFEATVRDNGDGTYDPVSFAAARGSTSPAAEALLAFYRQAFWEVFSQDPSDFVGKNLTPIERGLGGQHMAAWDKLPPGWTQESVQSFWDSLTGDVKHKVTKCMEKMSPHMDDPGAFCGSLGSAVGYRGASTKAARLQGRQEAILKQYLNSAGSRAVMFFDELPPQVQQALQRVKDQETLPSDVDRWLGDNNQQSKSMWASKKDATLLRNALIRVAHENPDLRPTILPFITKCA